MKFRLSALILWCGLYTASVASANSQGELMVSGSLSLSNDKLIEKAKGIRTLFLVVYNPESKMPMPYGAQKVDLEKDASGNFYNFEITTTSIRTMGGNAVLPTKLKVKARLDKDGSAGMDQPGDIIGMSGVVAKGSKNIKIVLDQGK
ncbi:MAG: hypothetical protein ACOH5I_07405 [Oligoflexus sp.]